MAPKVEKTASKAKYKSKGECVGLSPRNELQCRLVDALWTFWPAWQRWAEAKTEGERLTPQRTRIIAILQEKGPQIMSSLRDELGVSATNITALVDGLEKDGMVARRQHPDDRRATIIEVTEKVGSCKETKSSCMAYAERVGEVFSELSDAEARQLLQIVDKLKARLARE